MHLERRNAWTKSSKPVGVSMGSSATNPVGKQACCAIKRSNQKRLYPGWGLLPCFLICRGRASLSERVELYQPGRSQDRPARSQGCGTGGGEGVKNRRASQIDEREK